MSSWKRNVANAVGDALKLRIAPAGRVGPLLEADVLAHFLAHFDVDCVFDVGANVGQYGGLLRRVGYRGTIVSFEPIPSLAETVRDAARRDKNWFVETVALDERERTVPFNVMKANQFSSLRAPSHRDTQLFDTANVIAETIELETVRLETMFDRYEAKLGFRRPYLKMDTQGNDLAVARGAGDRLQRFVGLQSELAIKALYEGQPDYRTALDFYGEAGFALTAFVPNNDGHFPNLIEIDCIMYNRSIASALPAPA